MNNSDFQTLIREKGQELYRDMPWRSNNDPYFVLVSEFMLQQTQVDRVIPKFNQFITQFPNIETLARAPLSNVVVAWSGLGYNRRAKFLHDSAKKVVADFAGTVPSTKAELITLPGIGSGTAGAILAYGFNQPDIFIETNVRTVYFHHFFSDKNKISDAQLYKHIQETIDILHPREWYWALMDYGSYLKKQGTGHVNKSAHYKKQPALKGSIREVRGQIIRSLTNSDSVEQDLKSNIGGDGRFSVALSALINEGMVMRTGDILHLTK